MKVLFLAGGASHGAYQVGALKALEEMDWNPDLVMGVSVGAINGVGWCSGKKGQALQNLWMNLNTKDVYKLRPWREWSGFRTWTHLMSTSPLESFLRSQVDWDKLHHNKTELLISSINLRNGRSHLFSSKPFEAMQTLPATFHVDILNLESVLASGSIPGVFPIRSGQFWDGAFAFHRPFKPLVLRGMTEMVVVHMHRPFEESPLPKSPLETIWRITDIATSYPLLRDLEDLRLKNGLEGYRPISVFEVAPSEPLRYSKMNFSSPEKIHAIDLGYWDTREAFKKGR